MRIARFVTALVFALIWGCGEDATTMTVLPTGTTVSENHVPVINSIIASSQVVGVGGVLELFCDAFDEDGDELRYTWGMSQGTLIGGGAKETYVAPLVEGVYFVTCQANDRKGAVASKGIFIAVGTTLPTNHIPDILSFAVDVNGVVSGQVIVSCKVNDLDNDPLNYSLEAMGSSFARVSLLGNNIHGAWIVPKTPGTYHLFCNAYNTNEFINAELEMVVDESGVLSSS